MAVEFGEPDDLAGLSSLLMDLTDSETETDSEQGNPNIEKRSSKLKPEWSFFATKPESFAIKKQKPGPKPKKKMNSLIIPGLDPKRKKPGPKPKFKPEKTKELKKRGPKPNGSTGSKTYHACKVEQITAPGRYSPALHKIRDCVVTLLGEGR